MRVTSEPQQRQERALFMAAGLEPLPVLDHLERPDGLKQAAART